MFILPLSGCDAMARGRRLGFVYVADSVNRLAWLLSAVVAFTLRLVALVFGCGCTGHCITLLTCRRVSSRNTIVESTFNPNHCTL